MGTAAARKIRASCQLIENMTAMPMTTVRVVTTSMMAPKAIQRRRKFRSVMARESSWPEPHRSWKDTVRSCRCPYRETRIRVSTVVAGLMTNCRRRATSTASAMPRTRMTTAAIQTASGAPPAWSESLIRTRSTWGMVSATTLARSAQRSPMHKPGDDRPDVRIKTADGSEK